MQNSVFKIRMITHNPAGHFILAEHKAQFTNWAVAYLSRKLHANFDYETYKTWFRSRNNTHFGAQCGK